MTGAWKPPTRPKPPPSAPAAAGTSLPLDEPGRPLEAQRDELLVQIDELEGALRFMGTAHARRAEIEAQVRQLRELLGRLDEEMQRRRSP